MSSEECQLNILGLVKSNIIRDDLSQIFERIPNVSSKIVIGDFVSAYGDVDACKTNSIILLEVDKSDIHIAEAIKRYKKSCGEKQHRLVVVYDGLDDSDILRLLHAGVSDFLSLPLTAETADKSILRLVTPRNQYSYSGGNTENNKIISFVHASGGVGTTTIAVNSAILLNSLSIKERRAACLLDLDLQFGCAATHLDLPGYSPVMDLIDRPDHLDSEMLDGMMVRHSSGLPVLTASEIIFPIEAIGSDVIERVLHLSKQRYEYTVIDMPLTLASWTDTVLQNSDVIYAVMQLNVPNIKQLRRWFTMLDDEKLSDLPIKVIVNRYHYLGHFRQDNISIQQASESLGRNIDYMIPNDYDLVSHSLDQGVPAATLQPKSKFVQEIRNIMEGIEISTKHFAKD